VTKPLATPPDAERVIVDYLAAALVTQGQDVTVGVDIPTTWTPGTKPHVQVAWDGTPDMAYPVVWRCTVRVTAWATKTSDAKALAGLCNALLCVHEGSTEVGSVRPLTGTLPARDPDTDAELASFTVQVNLLGVAA